MSRLSKHKNKPLNEYLTEILTRMQMYQDKKKSHHQIMETFLKTAVWNEMRISDHTKLTISSITGQKKSTGSRVLMNEWASLSIPISKGPLESLASFANAPPVIGKSYVFISCLFKLARLGARNLSNMIPLKHETWFLPPSSCLDTGINRCQRSTLIYWYCQRRQAGLPTYLLPSKITATAMTWTEHWLRF